MKIEFLEAAPVRRALDEISALENAQREPSVRQAFADARAILDTAITRAANPELIDGIDIQTYAELNNLTYDGARKQVRRKLIATGAAEKRGGRYVIFVDRIAS